MSKRAPSATCSDVFFVRHARIQAIQPLMTSFYIPGNSYWLSNFSPRIKLFNSNFQALKTRIANSAGVLLDIKPSKFDSTVDWWDRHLVPEAFEPRNCALTMADGWG